MGYAAVVDDVRELSLTEMGGTASDDEALTLIRERACEGLRSRDVIACMKVSRRLAEMRFRENRGHSILDEIQDVRIEHAKQLLRISHVSVKAVANMCGYSSEAAFRKIYRKITNETPTNTTRRPPHYKHGGRLIYPQRIDQTLQVPANL